MRTSFFIPNSGFTHQMQFRPDQIEATTLAC
jgi:hypothetical protein